MGLHDTEIKLLIHLYVPIVNVNRQCLKQSRWHLNKKSIVQKMIGNFFYVSTLANTLPYFNTKKH